MLISCNLNTVKTLDNYLTSCAHNCQNVLHLAGTGCDLLRYFSLVFINLLQLVRGFYPSPVDFFAFVLEICVHFSLDESVGVVLESPRSVADYPVCLVLQVAVVFDCIFGNQINIIEKILQ